jgi:hypothetical protein
MKKAILLSLFFIAVLLNGAKAQEKYGNTLNVGVGIGYYGYYDHTIPVIGLNYEIDVARNFTLAPFVTVYSYTNYRYWGDKHYPFQNYYYHETVVPIGVKGTYYFDQILHASPAWDFYLAGSLGFAIRTVTWDDGYYGDRYLSRDASPLYLDFHIGTEYHISPPLGLFLDLSTGVSTFGLAFHLGNSKGDTPHERHKKRIQ